MQVIKSSKKRVFDMNNKKDIEIYKSFLETNSWKVSGSCPFNLEYPYLTVPDMIKDKLIRKFLKVGV